MKLVFSFRKILFSVSIAILNLPFSISLCLAADITSARTGSWNVSSTWSGGVVPQSGDNVFILPGNKITVNATTAVNSITFLNTAYSNSILSVNSGMVLNVTEGIILQNSENNNTTATIEGSGTINCNNVAVGATITKPIVASNSILVSTITMMVINQNLIIKSEVEGSINASSTFVLDAGTVLVKGSVVLDAPLAGSSNPKATLSFMGSIKTGTLNLAGQVPFDTKGDVVINANGANSTIIYSYPGDQPIRSAVYSNLILSGKGIKRPEGQITAKTVTIDENVTLDPAATNMTIQSGGAVNLNGTLDFTSPSGAIIPSSNSTKINLGTNAYIRTMNHAGLIRSDASFRLSGNASWDLSDISSKGTVEYYKSPAPTDVLINLQQVTDLDYNNLIISGTMLKDWTLSQSRTVNGNFTISNDAPLRLASYTSTGSPVPVLHLKGNWINNGTGFTAGFGTISFNGTSSQKIEGTAVTTFNNLIIDNENGVELTQSANVDDTLTLNKGLLMIPVSKTLALTRFSSKEILGKPFSATKHIVTQVNNNGQMGIFQVKNIPDNTKYLFPVGDGTYYLPATIKPSASNDFGVTVFKGITANGKPGYSLEEDKRKNVVNVVWDVTGSKNLAADLSLSWPKGQNLEGANVLATLENGTGIGITHFINGNWDDPSGTFDAINYTATRTNITTFSPFAIGLTGNYVLPVHFANVKASEKSSGVEIEFTNLTESAVAYYDIERSVGGQIFYAVKRIVPAKNNNGTATYAWIDNSSLEGKIVYRIRAVETSGKFIFSDSVSVKLETKFSGMNVFAKDGQVTLQIGDLQVGKYLLRILNIAGQVVSFENINHGGGALSQRTSLKHLIAGVYIYDVQGPVQMQKKFLVQ